MLVMLLLMYNVSLYGSHQWKSCSFIFWRLSLPFENSIGQGTEWSGCSVPAEFYMVTVLGERSGSSGLQKVAEMDSSPRLEALLEWVYQKYYHKIPGQDVVLNEGVCFFVKSDTLVVLPQWTCELVVFDVWDQEVQSITFQLAGK